MHIPDSAISPVTSLAACAAMLPVWTAASARVRKSLSTKQVPHLAIGAAFCFTIMMFNIPAPGGTTVHPLGGTLLAILLGPWAAVIGMTTALVIQALFFADGGVLALGANCFSMAFAMPLCGYSVYKVIGAGSAPLSSGRILAAALGAYAGLNAAALITAIILGIQPALFHDPSGRALFFPFGLSITLPAIMIPHLMAAGVAEAVVTAASVRYMQGAGIRIFESSSMGAIETRREFLWVGLGSLIALTPLGLLARGESWGEWGIGDLAKHAGYLPAGTAHFQAHAWSGFSLFPDYLSGGGPFYYVAAAMAGAAIIFLCVVFLSRLLRVPANPIESHHSTSTNELRSAGLRPGTVPSWLLAPAVADGLDNVTYRDSPALSPQRPRRPSTRIYLDKTLRGLAENARSALFAETLANRDGLLQKINPSIKVFLLMSIAAVTSISHRMDAVLSITALIIISAILSRIPLALFARRVFASVALFAGAVVAPCMFNLVTPGKTVIALMRHPYLSITDRGLESACELLLRVAAAMACAILLSLTTRWSDLLAGLGRLGIPRMFLVVLTMTYRYLGVLMQTAADTFTARISRTAGRATAQADRQFLGSSIGSLFAKTAALTDEVHDAMISRGWTGDTVKEGSIG